MKKFLCIGILSFLLVGCNTESTSLTDELQGYEVTSTHVELVEGDFIYRLVSTNEIYKEGEPVTIYAELEYVGEKDEIVIYHASSPFYFPVKERMRDYEIDYAMTQPLVATTLLKGIPMREPFSKSGGFSEQDEKEYISFMKKYWEGDGLPIGFYEIDGYASFYVEENSEQKEDFVIKGQINFKVVNKK